MKQDKDVFGYTQKAYERLIRKGLKYPEQLSRYEMQSFKFYTKEMLKEKEDK